MFRNFLLLGEVTAATVDLKPFIDSLTGSITPAQILTMLASVIGVGMAFVLMWFGVRKAIKIFKNAFKNGNISA